MKAPRRARSDLMAPVVVIMVAPPVRPPHLPTWTMIVVVNNIFTFTGYRINRRGITPSNIIRFGSSGVEQQQEAEDNLYVTKIET